MDRKTTFKEAKASYDLRSKVVHGSMNATYRKTLPGVTETTSELLRRILRQCLDDGHAPDVARINDDLLA